jgi:hypothetical protein
VKFTAPFACPGFTVDVKAVRVGTPRLLVNGKGPSLQRAAKPLELKPGTCCVHEDRVTCCLDLPKGKSTLSLGA